MFTTSISIRKDRNTLSEQLCSAELVKPDVLRVATAVL